jgi:hypothetical protein
MPLLAACVALHAVDQVSAPLFGVLVAVLLLADRLSFRASMLLSLSLTPLAVLWIEPSFADPRVAWAFALLGVTTMGAFTLLWARDAGESDALWGAILRRIRRPAKEPGEKAAAVQEKGALVQPRRQVMGTMEQAERMKPQSLYHRIP